MPIFSTWWQTFTSSPFCLLTFHINVKMAANKPSEQNGMRLAKCLPDYTPHFLPDLCSSFRGSFPPRITKFNKNFLFQRVGNSSLKNAVHKALWLHGAGRGHSELAILRSRMPCTKRYDSTERGEVIQKLTFSYSRHYLLCTCITVHCRTHKSPPVDTPLTQISPVHFLLQPLTSIKKLQTFLLPMRATCSVSPTFLH